MAECLTCKKALQGSWKMTIASTPFAKTGRYLGITDGHFLYSEGPNWVYCYCTTCWQKAILTLPFIPTVQQVNILQQQLSASQQNEANLRQQLRASQQIQTNLQQQLSTTQNDSAVYRKQLEEMSEKYNKLSNISDIEKLRDLLKQLTSSQIDTLHTHTQFWIDTFETVHDEQQFQCSSQFVQSILTHLKTSIDAVLQLRKNALEQAKQAKEGVFKMLTTANLPRTTIDASIKLLDTDIEQIEAGIKGWNTFSAALINTVNQSIAGQRIVTCRAVVEAVAEKIA